LSQDEYWRLTIPMLFREMAVAARRQAQEHDRDVRIAWLTAALVRSAKFPKLHDLLASSDAPQKAQDPATLAAHAHALAAMYGFKVTQGRPKT
jgi:hypothetical protein